MIERGQEWGTDVVLTGGEPVATTDAEVAALLDAGGPDTLVVLRGGDLFASLGGRPDQVRPTGAGDEVRALPVDLIEVWTPAHAGRALEATAGTRRVAVAHVVARRRGWAGEFAVGMGGTHLGDFNLGPKAHPNDGLLDVTRGRLALRDRLAARRRAPAGAHVPHPGLRTTRVRSDQWHFDRPTPLHVDGVAVGPVTDVTLTVLADRGRVVVG